IILATAYYFRPRQAPIRQNQQQSTSTNMNDPITKAFDGIKAFHGTAQDSSRDWCDRAEIIFNAYNINDVNRLSRIGIKLEDAAFDWYRDNQGPYVTWNGFRQALEYAFPAPARTQNRHLLAEQINQRKQGPDESIHDYYYALDKLCREYDPRMSILDKTIKLVGGLREPLKEKLLPLNIQTPEQFMIQAKNYESSEQVMQHHRKQNGLNELPEPTYTFESNSYSTVAASLPHYQQQQEQHFNKNYQQQQQNHQNYQQQQHHQNYQQNHHQDYQQRHHQQQHRQYQHPTYQQQNQRQPRTTKIHTSLQQQKQDGHPYQSYQQINKNTYQNSNNFECFKCGQQGTEVDGTVPANKKKPSTPLIVTLQVNKKFINVMVDTGSAKSIIHVKTLHELPYQPYINYKNNTHRTANNSELKTIGTVKLRIKIKNISTFAIAEISNELCTSLILGNDWITTNNIDIITTQQLIRKQQGSHIVTAPFTKLDQETYSVSPMIIGTISLPTPTTTTSSVPPTQHKQTYNISGLQCRVCYEDHKSKKHLFDHLKKNGHYSNKETNDQATSTVLEHIKRLTEHITNARNKTKTELILLKYAEIFDISKPTTITTTTITEHLHHLQQILSLLHHANFRVNPTKCEFLQHEIKFLGHMINQDGITPCPEKVDAITGISVPTNIKAATSFIKMAEYYRNHISNFSTIAQPFFDLTKKNAKFTWNNAEQAAFDKIKQLLISKPLLQFPDSNSLFIIQVDASNYGIGAVLMQNKSNGEQPIAYMSQKLNKQQRNWNATEKECFAIISSIKKWDHYIAGREFLVRTDHHALCWLNRKYNSNPKLNRWRMALQDYTFTIEHVKGNRNCVADCLSRYPVNPSCDDEMEQHSISTQTEPQVSTINAITTCNINNQQQLLKSTTTTPSATTFVPQSKTSKEFNQITVFTKEQLEKYQQQDTTIKKILENIDKKPYNDEYCIKNGLLCRNINRFYGIIVVPVVPKEKVKDVLLAYHNSSMNGAHLGKDKTYYKIGDRYYWPKMYNDIVQHVRTCPNCAINKYSRKKPDGYLNPVKPPEGVWENLSMDYMGPITPSSSSGNKYILVITDLLSKYVVTKATRDNSALTASKVLVEEVILRHGTPNQILTDNGTHFTAQLFNTIASTFGICHVFTTPYHPQANGVCERFNATMCDSLAAICNSKRTNWDEQLSKITFAYNTSRHVTTKLTPFELMYGRLCKLPFDLPTQTTTINSHQYVQQLQQYLKLTREMVQTNIELSQKKSKERYDLNRSNQIYSVGDFVYVKRLGYQNKLTQKYNGPYQVIQQLNDSTYRIQNPNDLYEIINVHVNRTRRCYL
ncbi:unnamed protein product, partial [Adineta steineri]